jgi:hypothetical protein
MNTDGDSPYQQGDAIMKYAEANGGSNDDLGPTFTDNFVFDMVRLLQSGGDSSTVVGGDGSVRITDASGNTLTYSGDPDADLMLLGIAPDGIA